MPNPDRMSALEQIVAKREGIEPKPKKKRTRWDRIDRELDEVERGIERLEELARRL